MLAKVDYQKAKSKTINFFDRVGIVLTSEEKQSIEVADFGLNELEVQGLELITYINNEHYCAKELVLFPNQTCPEHKHPHVGEIKGKTETFRCRWGKVWLYVEGKPSEAMQATVPVGSEDYYTVFHEVELNAGEQYTIPPNTLHWFQADGRGAIISEFSTTSRDESDIFTDPRIKRTPEVAE
ncbi:D-lyxose/D-mannose family sugar isomerase [Aquibacillus koreensis]|uniref:D-lyxose ketol-isomerase n=1 Tax=Aquibacillus koreensis TaxID=279446 RepID=A0A9X3WRZ2_9BACI|nr:D-lyxose/D-mannose family sugar isomerase [Aquibacillus koreensis]MCT2537022.1 D-lyxose/D-mannose family sugar isomerase [Aquibacillus koreensis]MDC3422324.1 D-lyxose/D-mannose family sugar isomerase [Aquibacillus koreensis]